ncbi:unnamed protein product (macronuclear) [Paramecium tetraurelia]|uniref:Histidine kinase domain-containing protein n=1 Tax=Paramecium tetraurelia TaxID=5888 RepID=A0D781_PARTE|nr:uncharacterized protein GSPATT00001940001 [Paramecium tetraurelia]CAK78898.1 unnamed protein product [Paramecium tetraurelia]|eukprot:XP_001446295.1 hypothetical protein (macronuclear) [Paramecium tetraurelia strain d4-2]
MNNRAMQLLGMSLNVLISVLLALIECFINELSDSIIMDIVFILCGTFFSWIYITQQLGWNKGDISPFFYWALAIKRITLVGINSSEFIYFLFGFLNGIYSNKLVVKDQKMYYKQVRNAIQVILISVLIVYNFLTNPCNHQIIFIISNIILLVLLGLYDNYESQFIGSKQEGFNTNQRNSQVELKKCQTIQQPQSTKSIWEQFNCLTDDWICKIDINKFKFNRTLETKEQSLVLQNFLQENKSNLSQFFSNLIIVRQSQNASIISQFELQENNTFLQWLEKNYLQETPQNFIKQKLFSDRQNINQQAEDDQKSMLSHDRRYINQNDLSQDLSGLQPLPLNVDIQTSNNKTFLQCYLCLNQIVYNLSLSIFLVDDDKTNQSKQQSIIIQMKNVDKLIKSEILDQQRSIFYKHIGRLATHSGEILKSVNVLKKSLQQQLKEFDYSLSFNDTIFKKSERYIGGISNPYQAVLNHTPESNTNQKLTSTHSNPHESQILNLQQLQIAYYQQSQEILKQIEKLNFDLIMMKQNNFNFFVLFSHAQLDIEQINISSSFNIVKDIFQQNPILNQHNIIITQEINHQTQVIIKSDKMKIKQILINIIKNSIENFELNKQEIQNEKNENLQTQQRQMSSKQDLKQQNMIVFKAHSDQDKIIIEISDNGGGINEEMLKNRLNDCRFGLEATQKLLRFLAYDTQKPMEIINYVKGTTGVQGTVIKFALPISRDNFQIHEENKQHESLIINKRTDKT